MVPSPEESRNRMKTYLPQESSGGYLTSDANADGGLFVFPPEKRSLARSPPIALLYVWAGLLVRLPSNEKWDILVCPPEQHLLSPIILLPQSQLTISLNDLTKMQLKEHLTG